MSTRAMLCCAVQVLGEVGALPDVYTELEVNFFLLRRLLGVRTSVSAWPGHH